MNDSFVYRGSSNSVSKQEMNKCLAVLYMRKDGHGNENRRNSTLVFGSGNLTD